METLLNISLMPDGPPVVSSDILSVEVKNPEKLSQWTRPAIHGFGNTLYERYGEDILRLVEESLAQEVQH